MLQIFVAYGGFHSFIHHNNSK